MAETLTLARLLSPRLSSLRRAIVEAVPREVPAFARSGAQFQADLEAAVALGFSDIESGRRDGSPLLDDADRQVFSEFGASEAVAGRGIEALLAAYRVALRVALDEADAATEEYRAAGGSVDVKSVFELVDVAFAYLEEISAASAAGYEVQARRMRLEREQVRVELFAALLEGDDGAGVSGTGERADVAGKAEEVDWPLGERCFALVASAGGAREVSRALSSGPSIAVLDGETGGEMAWIVAGGQAEAEVRRRLAGHRTWAGPSGPWGDLPSSLELARSLRGLEQRRDPDGRTRQVAGPTRVVDHLLDLVLAGDPVALDALRRRRLAPLDTLPHDTADRLAATLESWLRNWGSRRAVAEELYIHPQTVGYRLGRLRELLGDDLDDPRARVELLVVLTSAAPDLTTPGDPTRR